MTGWRASFVLAALLAVAGGSAAYADELVTRDGQIIQTRGPWEVRGKLLVFKLADGTLASLRLDEADLEASEERARQTELAARRAQESSSRPELEPPSAVLVLTDRDVAHVVDRGEEPGPEVSAEDASALAAGDTGDLGTAAGESGGGDQDAAAGADDGSPVSGSGRGVQVVQWSQENEGDTGVSVRGVIQNLGDSFATSLSVNALFYDEAGGLIAAREVQFEDGPLGPGARRDFSVSLPHSLVFDEIKFQVVGRGFRSVGQSVRTGPPQEPAEFEDIP